MKSFLLIFFFALPSFALEIRSIQALDANNVYRIHTVIQCTEASPEACLEICGHPETCSRPEPVCVNCAGTANEMIRILFTRLESFYQPTMDRLPEADFVNYLKTQKYVLLSHESVYNFHRSWGSGETLALFQSFCQLPTAKPLLLVGLDSIGQPQELKGVICQDQIGSYVQKVQPRAAATEEIKINMDLN